MNSADRECTVCPPYVEGCAHYEGQVVVYGREPEDAESVLYGVGGPCKADITPTGYECMCPDEGDHMPPGRRYISRDEARTDFEARAAAMLGREEA